MADRLGKLVYIGFEPGYILNLKGLLERNVRRQATDSGSGTVFPMNLPCQFSHKVWTSVSVRIAIAVFIACTP
jgi:hypothetical protein